MSSAFRRLIGFAAVAVAMAAFPPGASAAPDAVSSFTWTKNMHPLGHSESNVPLANATPGAGIYNSDLAFWGRRAYEGSYDGFRIIDISDPEAPQELIDYKRLLARNHAGQPGRRDRVGRPSGPLLELAGDGHLLV